MTPASPTITRITAQLKNNDQEIENKAETAAVRELLKRTERRQNKPM
jgi:hypothetical protein